MSDFAKKAKKSVEERIEEAGKSGKSQIFAIPYLNSVRKDDAKVGLAKMLGDPDSEAGITIEVPKDLVDFKTLFNIGFRKKLEGSCASIGQRIISIKQLCKEDLGDEDPGNLITQLEPGSVIALVSFDVTITTAESTWREIKLNPVSFENQVKQFKQIAEGYISKCYDDVEAKAKNAFGALGTCIGAVQKGGVEQAMQTITDANKALAFLYDTIGDQVTKCQTNIAMACANSLSAVIKFEIKEEKAILATRGKKVVSVGEDAVVIVAHAAHGAGTMGATGGLAIAGIVRAGIDMGQTVWDCILTLDVLAKEIDGYIWAVQEIYLSGKAKQMVQEGAIAIIQGVTCLDLPTVSTCYKKIEEYEYKITLLQSSCNQVRRQQQLVREKLDDYKKMYKDQDSYGGVSVQNRKDWGVFIGSVTKTYIDLMIIGDDKDRRIKIAGHNVEVWKVTLAKFDTAVSKVGQVTDTLASLAFSGSTSIGGVGAEAVDHTLHGLELAYGVILEMGTGVADMLKDVFKRS